MRPNDPARAEPRRTSRAGGRLPAGQRPKIGHVRDARSPAYEDSSARAIGARPQESPLDDWLGDISDDDWSEQGAEPQRRRAAPAERDPFGAEADLERGPPLAPARPEAATEAHQATVGRRRLLAVLLLLVLLGIAVAIPAILLRDGGEAQVTTVAEPATSTTPAPTASTTTPPDETTPSTSPEATGPTTPSTDDPTGFTLPEGTKLQRSDDNPEAIRELQEALTAAGYDPGAADGKFGEQTEEAVIAFQQANDLSTDGVVGMETATALNSALASG